jgi:hypothetical protein
MTQCRRCRGLLSEGAAQQSIVEMEATLLSRIRSASAPSKAKMEGPLCECCLARWTHKQQALPPRKVIAI